MKKNSPPLHEERLLLAAVTVLFLVLFTRLYINLNVGLKQTEQNYLQGRAINLRTGIRSDLLRNILSTGNYYTNEKDLDLVTDSLVRKIEQVGTLDNLGAINKREFSVIVPMAAKSLVGGEEFQSRVAVSRQRLGFDANLYRQELTHPTPLPAVLQVGSGELSISGQVVDATTKQPLEGVRVQLQTHNVSSLDEQNADKYNYARTDAEGSFSFTGLTADSGYSVLPLKPGLEFGSRLGTASLDGDLDFTFRARPHKLRLISSQTFGQLKDDKALTVRTPAEFRSIFFLIVLLLVAAFWGVHFFWSLRRFPHDPFLLPILMFLVGMSILTLLSIQDPLQDAVHAYLMMVRGAIGLVGMAVISQLNIGKFYTHWTYDFLFNFSKKSFYNLQGWTWLAAALGLALLTLLFGTGPEGSGVKVNLNVGFLFQPSEVTKFLLLLFFAGFFAANEERIRQLSDARWRFRVSFGVLIGAGLLMFLYLLLGDMGPALVVCFTFLIFYSIARGNLAITLGAGALYGMLLYFLPALLATGISVATTVSYMVWQKNFQTTKWYGWAALVAEAPVILILIIAVFTFGDKLPSVGERLADRKNMWLSQWDNNVYGGDHLAHGYWTLSSGGFSGQGLGKGFANTMPAAHTDMLLPSIGEELGWLGLVAIFLLFGVLVHRIFLIARRAGQPFSFYLCAGIGIATGVQFLLIAGGSIGLLPLTGVSVPFLSFGSTALAINLLVMGVVFSISGRPGEDIQQEYLEKHYDPVLVVGIVGFLVGILGLIVKLSYVQLWAGKEYIVKPARVINRNGLPVYSYNPRIEIFTRELAAGNIYDRNRHILATSSPELIKKSEKFLAGAGLEPRRLEHLTRKRLRRYYPFEEHLFFWVGDYNTRLFWGQENGYFAEAGHLSQLRGFDTKPAKNTIITTRFQTDRFSKPITKAVGMVAYDYSAIAGLLRAGLGSKETAALKAKNRDLTLSVDAALQVELQKAIMSSEFKNKRTSVVVLDAASGDVLASAIHPLPNLQAPEAMLMPEKEKSRLSYPLTDRDLGMTYSTAPGSTAKILTALAAFNKLGEAAADISYNDIGFEEIIRKGQRESEPYNEPIDMKKAIVRSSNVYFIRIANENNLDNEMAHLYLNTGMNIDYVGGYSYNFDMDDNRRERILRHWRDSSFVVNRQFYQKWRGIKRNRYNSEFSGLAWGQGQLTATPASVARVAAGIATNGLLQPSRYVLEAAGIAKPIGKGVAIIKKREYAEMMQSFMIEQSNPNGASKISISKVAGKTGTPERKYKGQSRFDGWYVFFAPTPDGKSHTVVCVRIELGESSANAVKLANDKVVPILRDRGYLGTF
jgi:cell division protein FtsW (lipid II flippase)/cell division protein FtsI/penicillin-binding protein 2